MVRRLVQWHLYLSTLSDNLETTLKANRSQFLFEFIWLYNMDKLLVINLKFVVPVLCVGLDLQPFDCAFRQLKVQLHVIRKESPFISTVLFANHIAIGQTVE